MTCLQLVLLTLTAAVTRELAVESSWSGELAPSGDHPQHAELEGNQAMLQVCRDLGIAYLVALPIPCPPPGVSVVPAVGLAVCCPVFVKDKVVEYAKKANTKLRKMSHSKAEQFMESIIPSEYFTDAQLEVEAEKEIHAEVMDLYRALVKEHSLRNPSNMFRKLESSVRHRVGKFSKERFSKAEYGMNMAAMKEIEQEYPWVLYPRLEAAYNDARLTAEEKERFVNLLVKLKTEHTWLPTIDTDPELPAILKKNEADEAQATAIAQVQEELSPGAAAIAAAQKDVDDSDLDSPALTGDSPIHEEEGDDPLGLLDSDQEVANVALKVETSSASRAERLKEMGKSFRFYAHKANDAREFVCKGIGRFSRKAIRGMMKLAKKPSNMELDELKLIVHWSAT